MRGFMILAAAMLAVCVLAGDSFANGFGNRSGRQGIFSGRNFRGNDVTVQANGVRVDVDNRLIGRDQTTVSFNNGNFNSFRFGPSSTFRNNRGDLVRVDAFGNTVLVASGSRNSTRVNVFGTSTFTDEFGRVFEVDQFGNFRLVASSVRGFAVSPGGYRFNGVGFGSFNNFGVSSFGGCH